MGWGRTLFLGDIGNRLDIADTERDIDHLRSLLHDARRVDQDQDRQIAALQRENDELKLYLASLVRLLARKQVVTGAEISAFVDTIDEDRP